MPGHSQARSTQPCRWVPVGAGGWWSPTSARRRLCRCTRCLPRTSLLDAGPGTPGEPRAEDLRVSPLRRPGAAHGAPVPRPVLSAGPAASAPRTAAPRAPEPRGERGGGGGAGQAGGLGGAGGQHGQKPPAPGTRRHRPLRVGAGTGAGWLSPQPGGAGLPRRPGARCRGPVPRSPPPSRCPSRPRPPPVGACSALTSARAPGPI